MLCYINICLCIIVNYNIYKRIGEILDLANIYFNNIKLDYS